MNGLELLKKIKSIDSRVPVVAITANSIIDIKYKDGGFVSYLSKPFKEEELLNIILNVLFPQFENTDIKNQDNINGNQLSHNSKNLTYSVEGIIDFVGNEPEAIRKIVKSFVNNSLITLKEMNDLLLSADFEAIASKAHKLIPLFKQFRLLDIVPNLEKLERFRELSLSDHILSNITRTTIGDSEIIVHKIEKEWLI